MKCDLAQQNIALVVYGELPDDECHALEQHLATCSRCQEEFEAVKALQQAMALAPSDEPSANLLAQTRMRLEEALDNLPRNGWLVRAKQSIMGGLATLSRAPSPPRHCWSSVWVSALFPATGRRQRSSSIGIPAPAARALPVHRPRADTSSPVESPM